MRKSSLPRRFPLITPQNAAAATSGAIIVADTNKFVRTREQSLIWFPEAERADIDKNLEIGIVVAVGDLVPKDEVKPGDVILYKSRHAYRLPNGVDPIFMFKIDYPFSVIAVLGDGDLERDIVRTV